MKSPVSQRAVIARINRRLPEFERLRTLAEQLEQLPLEAAALTSRLPASPRKASRVAVGLHQ